MLFATVGRKLRAEENMAVPQNIPAIYSKADGVGVKIPQDGMVQVRIKAGRKTGCVSRVRFLGGK